MPHSPGGWRSYALTVQNGTELIALEYRCVRCLFCNTGKERQVVRLITEKGWGRAIFPQRIKKVLKNKTATKGYTELTYEVRLSGDNTSFTNRLSACPGVESAVIVEFTGDYFE